MQSSKGTKDRERAKPSKDMDIDEPRGQKRAAEERNDTSTPRENTGSTEETGRNDLPSFLTYICISASMKASKTPIKYLKARIKGIFEKLRTVDNK